MILMSCVTHSSRRIDLSLLFFFNDTATTEIYTLSLHDALPISVSPADFALSSYAVNRACGATPSRSPQMRTCGTPRGDRKSTRLNSSHANISYAVFCLKKKIQRGRARLSMQPESTRARTDCIAM